ncbi:MAG: hypothetical protein GEU97_08855 [Actinophytocola sp.]|nr:hypothetical protein [Actinophytocola sp.]
MAATKLRSLIVLASAAALVITVPTLATAQPGGGAGDGDYEIALKSRTFTPSPGIDEQGIRQGKGPRDDVHFYAQFTDLPNAPRRAEIAGQGVDLLDYVVGNTYIAVSSVSDLDTLRELDDLRWAGPIAEDDKISPALRRGEIGKWAQAGKGRILISAQGHADIGSDEISALVERGNGEVVSETEATRSVIAIVAPGQVRELSKADPIQYLAVVEPRLEGQVDMSGPTSAWTPSGPRPTTSTAPE